MTQQSEQGNEGQNEKTFDEKYVKELREEAAKYRTQLREKEQELNQLKQQATQQSLEQAARAKGAVDPRTVAQLVDPSTVTDPDSAVDQLLKERPFLAGGDVGRPSNPPGSEQIQSFTRSDIERMTPEQINENWETIAKQLESGEL